MVRIKDAPHILPDGSIDLQAWLQHLNEKHHYDDDHLIRNACLLSQVAGEQHATETGESCLQQGLAIAEILADLELDQTTLAAAIVYDSMLYADLSLDDIREQLGEDVSKLVAGVHRMNAIDIMRSRGKAHSHSQLDNFRKMLIAMVDDVRVVLIKLAERLRVLRAVAKFKDGLKQQVAQEAIDIYAPLANRLGVGQLKWEMEDYAFRYLQPERYQEIAKGLQTRRVDRDKYVHQIVDLLQQKITDVHLKNAKIYGRSKHIHSIYKKMQRKNIDISQIYDATAVRVLVENIEDCYTVLSLVHEDWKNVPEEFDDYIANPKPNGYRSLHTAVCGPKGRVFEVQIRTYTMHDEAELGVAAHWSYKETGASSGEQTTKAKIDWLRQVLAWQKEVASDQALLEPSEVEYIEDRIYVFTPTGDIVDLPQGATPLDFAYTIHSEIGHRCRGAKINGKMVPLIHTLETGDRIEVLTTKQHKPSRDWLNPSLGYIHTSRARAKVHHWFKLQDYEKNLDEGKHIFEKELKKLGVRKIDEAKITEKLNFKLWDDVLAALGRGDLRITQIVAKIPQPEKEIQPKKVTPPPAKKVAPSDLYIEGIGNLLTRMAKCCNPLPGDSIVGYITLGRGISIHRQDCTNILQAQERQKERLLEVSWGEKISHNYPVEIIIEAYDRKGLIHDITTVLSNESTNLLAINTTTDKEKHVATMELTVEISNLASLSRLLDKIKQLPNVIKARRLRK